MVFFVSVLLLCLCVGPESLEVLFLIGGLDSLSVLVLSLCGVFFVSGGSCLCVGLESLVVLSLSLLGSSLSLGVFLLFSTEGDLVYACVWCYLRFWYQVLTWVSLS